MSPTVTAIVVVVIGLVLVGIAWAAVLALRSAPSDAAARSGTAPVAEDRIRPILMDFHVRDTAAMIYYNVPLADGDVDGHLKDLLCHDASLVLHDKRASGLPIDQVVTATVYGRRGDSPVEVGVMELESPGVIPEIAVPELIPRASMTGYDPLAHLGEQEFEVQPGVADREPKEGLGSFLDEITIARSVEAELRGAGIDPVVVSLEDLALSLLRIGGYDVSVGRAGVSAPEGGTAEMFTARKAGSETLVVIVPHASGEHPELSERIVNTFVIEVAQQNPQRALLVTDKFSPYVVYEKERSDPRCRFITRERLQAFVDSFAIQ
ncbi:MAG: hypothetical protein U9R51_03755 [Actinomycetota bacterium]|nr:hypothetical protein [Actinomycetota bacterium]